MRSEKAKNVARLGMLFALAIALSFCESCLTPLLGLMPAMKLGLSNIVVMYALLYLSKRQALALVLLKALFALLTRGVSAGFLSLCGGLVSWAFCACCWLCRCRSPAISFLSAGHWLTMSASCAAPPFFCPTVWR